jgi:tetratricopeptide (TPR) repeat protein
MHAHKAVSTAVFAALLVLAGAAAPPTPAFAAPEQKPAARPPGKQPVTPRAASTDELFERLAKAKDESEAKGLVATIERRWMRSGSDTADLLMSRALDALKAQDQPLAVELLDRVVNLRPEWAEAWNKRATVFFMMGDLTRSMADIREVLAREPRHYGALAGMGVIMQGTGDTKHAYEAFKKALAVNPFLSEVKSAVEKMAPEMEGRDI